MKKTLLIITIICSFFFTGRAQPYVPLLDSVNHWKFIFDFIPLRPEMNSCQYVYFMANSMTADIDTIMNGMTYKKIIADNSCLFGYMREDTATRKVYFVSNQLNPEVLIYDFSMQVNDSIPVQFFYQGPNQYWSDGYYVLDSVTQKWTAYGMRNQFNLNCHSCANSRTLIWIEGVGNSANPIYNFSGNIQDYGLLSNYGCSGFPYDKGGMILTCFEHAQRVYYDSCALSVGSTAFDWVFVDSCTYNYCCGGVNDFDFSSAVLVKTNPFHEKTELLIEKNLSADYRLRLIDQTGRVVRDENVKTGNIIIDRYNLSNGIYSFVLIDKAGHYAIGKLILQ
jgi:hypothetical protein